MNMYEGFSINDLNLRGFIKYRISHVKKTNETKKRLISKIEAGEIPEWGEAEVLKFEKEIYGGEVERKVLERVNKMLIEERRYF